MKVHESINWVKNCSILTLRPPNWVSNLPARLFLTLVLPLLIFPEPGFSQPSPTSTPPVQETASSAAPSSAPQSPRSFTQAPNTGPRRVGIPFQLPERAKLLRLRSAVIETSKGTIFLELYPDQAPWHVANFKYLADTGYYAGLRFHIFQEGFLIQGGAPRGDPLGGPGYSLPAEFNADKQVRGTLGMGRVMDQLNPERRSHGSQFYILTGSGAHMTGQYTAFGRVAKGMDVVDELREGDIIRNVTVYVRP